MDELLARQKKELKELQGKIMGMKKSVPKGDKKKKKEVTAEIARLEAALDMKHETERNAFEAGDSNASAAEQPDAAAATTEAAEATEASGQVRKSRAAKRREKKEQEERERQRRIEEAEPEDGTTKREMEDVALAGMLKPLSLTVKPIPANGDCMFSSVAVQVDEDTKVVREKTADYLRQHPDDFAPFLTNDKGDVMSKDEFEAYCTTMRDTAAWGGECELMALAKVYNRPIKVFQVQGTPREFGEGAADNTILLSYHQHQYGLGAHYNAVVPA
eukprot:TRINITY_DN11492_c6_g1_i6.p1 TRINITY_DN11492_c6_g1~~TRINITY_DN11492_c6_g1_i6.p1  ORF type:complete len:274 (+),score=84.29 TRINITY_DN11492_c6_g1_i6:21-842(+)